jgi:cystathionine beta-synthase
MYNDYWLLDQNLAESTHFGDLRDLITRRYSDNAIIYARPKDALKTVYARFKLYDISQIPVMDDGKVVGIIDESDLLLALNSCCYTPETLVEDIMKKDLVTVTHTASTCELFQILNSGMVAIVKDADGRFEGLITRIDFINYLHRINYHQK